MNATDRRYNPRSAEDGTPIRKKGKNQPDKARVQSVVRRSAEQAVKFYKEHLEPDQKEATDYYHGRPFGDEEDGRSKVVSTDVRDSVLPLLASLVDVFTGPERAVEFAPWGAEDAAVAEQQTDYINHVVLQQDNRWYETLMAWAEDGCVRRIGAVQWWWDDFARVERSTSSGLDEVGLGALRSDPSVSDVQILDASAGETGTTYRVRVTRKHEGGRVRVEAMPSEEFVFTPDARDLDTAPLVGRVREVPVDTLVAMGVPEKTLEKVKGTESDDVELDEARTFHDSDPGDDDDIVDEAQRKVLYGEFYVLVDADGDGVAERRKFCTVGREYEIVNGDGLGEIVDEVPIAIFTPYPLAHTLVGLGIYDLLRDIQRINSQVQRAMLNSLALAVEPKMEVVVGEVNMKDLTSPDINGIVRVQKPGMLREIGHAFVGPATLDVLSYYDNVKESRTGRTRAAAGLDPDSLQSSTKAAVAATVSASQAMQKFVARTLAETGVKRLFRGLARLIVKNQRKARTVRLRGQWVEVDPRHWNAEADVIISVGLGQGTPEDRLMAMKEIIGDHNLLMQAGAPIVGWREVRSARAKALEMIGIRNADEFYRPFGVQEEQQMAEMQANQPQQPSPELMIAQIEAQKAQAQAQTEMLKAQNQAQIEAQKLDLERWKAQMEDDRERDRIAREMALREVEIELKYSTMLADAAMANKVEADRARMDAENQRIQAENQPSATE